MSSNEDAHWHPGTMAHSGMAVVKDAREGVNQELPEAQSAANEDVLPIRQHRDAVMKLIKENQIVIICGETGSGKSTQIPQLMMQDGIVTSNRKLAIVEPRRIAASSLATRVAQEMDVEVGSEVGYTVRFDNRSSSKTTLKYMTNGLLVREILADPKLSGYGALLIDEAHERNVETDIMLGLVQQLLKYRSDIKIIISSATLDAEKLASFFGAVPVYNVPGRRFPVTVLYQVVTHSSPASYRELAAEAVAKIHLEKPTDGDILVFLPGQHDIDSVEEQVWELSNEWNNEVPELIIVPVYANMANDQQAKIFQKTPRNARKVVLATNIAETSLTIPGIKYVIDTGLVKQQNYNAQTAMDTLETVQISQASAEQRAGRAGRTGPGICYRLYSKSDFMTNFAKQTIPEILRANLSQVCLLLLALGIENVLEFPWVDPPSSESVVGAFQLLYALGAVNQDAVLTKLGRILAEFPLDPMLSKSLLTSITLECTAEFATIAAMLNEMGALYVQPKGKKEHAKAAHDRLTVDGGDQFTLLNIFKLWASSGYSRSWCRDYFLNYRSLQKARKIKDQLLTLVDRIEPYSNVISHDKPRKDMPLLNRLKQAIVSGYFLNTGRLSKNNQDYVGYNFGTSIALHPSSVLWGVKPLPKLINYHELVLTSKAYARGCIEIERDDIRSVAPFFFHDKQLSRNV